MAAQIQWKIKEVPLMEETDSSSPLVGNNPPQVIGQADFEITLIDRLPPWMQKWAQDQGVLKDAMRQNLYNLKPEAFCTQDFTIRMERGIFKLPYVKKTGQTDLINYKYCLIFNTSPYPPIHKWRPERLRGPEYWEEKEFVCQILDVPVQSTAP
jgi:hypothetical protein